MKKVMMSTALSLAVMGGSLPARADIQPSDILRVATTLIIYSKDCGPLPPDAQRVLQALDPMLPHDPPTLGAMVMTVTEQMNAAGQKAWCSGWKTVIDQMKYGDNN